MDHGQGLAASATRRGGLLTEERWRRTKEVRWLRTKEVRWLRTKEVRWLGTKEARWGRIKNVFQAAAERGPVEREAYLASETAGDDELRHEVEKMLRHATGAGVLDRPAWEGLRIEKTLDAGSRVGPYEIVEEAGAGGMGRVYKARDTRLGRTVAIKVLSAEFSHRLRIEGRAISSLNHPHVCALYDIGDQDGAAYLVMEYVEGRIACGPPCPRRFAGG